VTRDREASDAAEAVFRWADDANVDPRVLPDPAEIRAMIAASWLRPPAEESRLAAWEERHGFALPRGLRAWLAISDGLYHGSGRAPLVHPLASIGPMIPFARMPGLLVQPESWFELGNPGAETVCIDLGYRWPGGDRPLFTSGDDDRGRAPMVIAPSFEAWLARIVREGCREFWLDPGFPALGDPWTEHRRHVPPPALPDRLRLLAGRARPLLAWTTDDRALAARLGVSRQDAETLLRYLQHQPVATAVAAAGG